MEKVLEMERMRLDLERSYHRLLRAHGSIGYGPGWHQLIRALFEGIDELLTDAQAEAFCVQQIKEKFGTLRFYYSVAGQATLNVDIFSSWGSRRLRIPPSPNPGYPTEAIDALIDKAERASEVTCENCGRPGLLRTSGWYHVRCDLCEELSRRGRR